MSGRQAAKRFKLAAAALALAGVAACGAEAGSTADAASASPRDMPGGGAEAARADATPSPGESDRLRLGMAEAACRADDFEGFFFAFSGSAAVRARYTAAEVGAGLRGSSRLMTRRDYLDRQSYPIATIDMSFVTAASAAAFARGGGNDPKLLRPVALEFNTAGDNRRGVDWATGTFEQDLDPAPADLEEGPGALIEGSGPSGTLLFRPTATCWELFDDVQNPPPG
ncbi:hypothetical protein [Sphingopyxis solisilvae]|uniref:hypothetical protein n=1 Tax=Sphingopyxis solisilvae TaxID=1886788 RepID=UPI001892C512|nr:hypothetical protein [Sphingopyxis solisilvae]